MSNPPKYPRLLLTKSDQVFLAALVIVALGCTAAWFLWHGGLQSRLIEFDRAEPLSARFEVDVNSADSSELRQLPGVGPKLSQRIIESRETAGPFARHDDLLRVKGIGPKILERMRPYLAPMPNDQATRKNNE